MLLHDLQGETLWIQAAAVEIVRHPDAAWGPAAGAVLTIGGHERAVAESPEAVLQQLRQMPAAWAS